MKKLVLILHFLLASIATTLIACLLQTQMVLLGLTKLDIHVSLSDRVYMSWQDLLGLIPTYGGIITLGLLIGFGVCKLIILYSPFKSPFLYIFAGGAAMAVILLAMQPVMGITLVAGARSALGIALQVVAGMLGGFCFMRLRRYQHSAN